MEAAVLQSDIEPEVFNNVLDRILDIFSNGELEYSAEDEELLRAQENYNLLAMDTREQDLKRVKLQPVPLVPKIMKNDIRRYYSRMFMNTLNSADFTMLQDYYYTFMRGPCKFNANVQAQPQHGIPGLMVAEGPRLMSHYTLGCFVMYPDMVMSMSDSKIVTSNSWSGSKIVMEVEFRATKMHDIELESWLPELSKLAESYEAAFQENALAKAIADKQGGCDNSDDTTVETTCSTPQAPSAMADRRAPFVRKASLEPADLRRILPSTPAVQAALKRDSCQKGAAASNDSSPSSVADATEIIESEPIGLHDFQVSAASTPRGAVYASEQSGGYSNTCGDDRSTTHITALAAASSKTLKRKPDQMDDNSSCISKSSVGSAVNSRTDAQFPHIPEEFVHSLFARAKLLPKPIPLLLQGQITMFLDESNHIQHMCETLVQKPAVPFGEDRL